MKKPIGEKWERVLHASELRASGHSVPEIAKIVGVNPRTVDRWIAQEWWEIAEEETLGGGRHNSLIYLALSNIRDRLEDGDPTTTRWVLERGDRWFRNKKADEGEPAAPKAAPPTILTDEDIAEYEELLNEDFDAEGSPEG